MITSTTLSLSAVLTTGTFTPAKVQREFQWQTLQVTRLLDDLVGAFQRMGLDPGEAEFAAPVEAAGAIVDLFPLLRDNAEAVISPPPFETGPDPAPAVPRIKEPVRQIPDAYYLGSLVLFTTNDTEFEVYDGLQRMTSLIILLCVLRDSWPQIPQDDAAALQTLLKPIGTRTERRLNFPTSGATLAYLIEGRKLIRTPLTEGDMRMRDAINLFQDQLNARWNSARRTAFLAFLQDKIQLTLTRTDNHSVAYQMFVGANARGLDLHIGDVLKGLMADQVRANGGTVKQIAQCTAAWKDGQQTLRQGFDDFLHAFEAYTFRPDLGEDDEPDEKTAPRPKGHRRRRHQPHTTGEKLQLVLSQHATPDETHAWLTSDYAAMVKVFERSRAHVDKDQVQGLDRAFLQLSFLSWREWQPFYLALGLRYPDQSRPAYVRHIERLVRACYLIELLGWSEGKRRVKFMRAIEHLEAGRNPFTYVAPNDAGEPGHDTRSLLFFAKDIALALRALRAPLMAKEKRGAIVRWIETLHWGAVVPRSCSDNANVEHVLPVNAEGEWTTALFNEQERDDWTHRLGNLCIISKRMNSDLGRAQWDQKRRAFEAIPGTFKGARLVLETSAAELPDGEQRPWCAARVQQLTQQLIELAEQALREK